MSPFPSLSLFITVNENDKNRFESWILSGTLRKITQWSSCPSRTSVSSTLLSTHTHSQKQKVARMKSGMLFRTFPYFKNCYKTLDVLIIYLHTPCSLNLFFFFFHPLYFFFVLSYKTSNRYYFQHDSFKQRTQ